MLLALAASVHEWATQPMWFTMRQDSCMAALQLLMWLRSVDARMRRASGGRAPLFPCDTDEQRAALRRAVQCARAHIVDRISERVASARVQRGALQGSATGTASASTLATTTGAPRIEARSVSQTLSDLAVYQFDAFVAGAGTALAGFAGALN